MRPAENRINFPDKFTSGKARLGVFYPQKKKIFYFYPAFSDEYFNHILTIILQNLRKLYLLGIKKYLVLYQPTIFVVPIKFWLNQ